MTPTILLLYCVGLFVRYFSRVFMYFCVDKNRFHTWLAFAMKTYRKRIASGSRRDIYSAYHSSSYTVCSSRFTVHNSPRITLKIDLLVWSLLISTVRLEPKNGSCVYVKKIMTKTETRTQHAQWHTVLQKSRISWNYDVFDTIKIPQHKYTYIHTFVRER